MAGHRQTLRKLILSLLLLVATFWCVWAGAVTRLDASGHPEGVLIGQLQVLEDPKAEATIDQILGQRQRFRQVVVKTPNYNFSSSAFWFRLTIQNRRDQSIALFLEEKHPAIDDLTLYVVHSDNRRDTIHSGDRIAGRDRPYPGSTLVLPFLLAAGESAELYLRAKSEAGTILVPFELLDEHSLEKSMLEARLVHGIMLGLFLSLFVATLLVVIFVADYFLSTSSSWSEGGVLLKVFGLLTLVNAPFDWIAVGLTRALLRRGLAPGGRGPYFYALIDAIVAVPLIMLLAVVTILAAQTFDDIAVLRAGPQARLLPLGPLFEGLETRPGDTEFWWIWFMLFSTLIPSLINLVIGAAAFLRGLPSLNAWILNRMPEGKAVRENDRLPVACALAGQLAGGLFISGVLLYLLAAYVVPIGIPTLGACIRDFSEQVAAFNAPARLMMLLHGSP